MTILDLGVETSLRTANPLSGLHKMFEYHTRIKEHCL